MSFKRDGDDGSQLNLLKKRRVAELLAKDIPDDEAMLMSNGRYACTVCHYKPIFDTVDMLTVHRAGKKHQHATEKHFAKKRELALLVQKRRMEAEIKKGTFRDRNEEKEPSPLLQKVEAAKRHTLLKEAPYNPCHTHKNEGPSKNSKNKLFFQGIRKVSLKNKTGNSTNRLAENSNLADQDRAFSRTSEHTLTSVTAQSAPMPGFSNIHKHNAMASSATAYRKAGIMADSESTSQTPAPGATSIQIKPYVPKAKRTAMSAKASPSKQPGPESKEETHPSTSTPAIHNPSSFSTHSPVYGEEVMHPSIEFITEFQNADNKCGEGTLSSVKTISSARQKQNQSRVEDAPFDCPSRTMRHDQSQNIRRPMDIRLDKDKREERKDGRMGGVEEEKTKRTPKTQQKSKSKMTDEKRKELQRYLELTSAGWVQDNGGNWVKREDVEFDSDEEPPIS